MDETSSRFHDELLAMVSFSNHSKMDDVAIDPNPLSLDDLVFEMNIVSRNVGPLTYLTRKDVKYEWMEKQNENLKN